MEPELWENGESGAPKRRNENKRTICAIFLDAMVMEVHILRPS